MINVFWFVNDGHCCTQFNKDSGKMVEEYKLRVVYLSPQAARGNSEDEALTGVKGNFDNDSVSSAIFLSLSLVVSLVLVDFPLHFSLHFQLQK